MKKSTRRIYDEDYAPQPSGEEEDAELQQQDKGEDEDCPKYLSKRQRV